MTQHIAIASTGIGFEPVGEDHSAGIGIAPRVVNHAATAELAILDECAFTRECMTRVLQSLDLFGEVLAFSHAEELAAACIGRDGIRLILFSIGTNRTTDPQIGATLEFLRSHLAHCAIVVISDFESQDRILEAICAGVRGYISPSTSLDVAVEVLRLVGAGGTYVPATSLSPAAGPHSGRAATQNRGLEREPFTPQQLEVLRRIGKGKPNKIIAHELLISESTVKVHIRNIMRKIKATNRTEVAFLTRDICKHDVLHG